jgi:hypothetical protein
MPNEQAQGQPIEAQGQPPEGQEWKPSKQDEAYTSALLKAVHSKKTRKKVHDMLGSTYPEVAVPKTALMINELVEKKAREGGKPPSLETLLYANTMLINDLIEVGNLAEVWEQPVDTEEQVGAILQDTMQQYIQKGLKDGTIDPVELQQKVEPLMSEEHRTAANQWGQKAGVPQKAGEAAAMEQYAQQRVRKQQMLGGQ